MLSNKQRQPTSTHTRDKLKKPDTKTTYCMIPFICISRTGKTIVIVSKISGYNGEGSESGLTIKKHRRETQDGVGLSRSCTDTLPGPIWIYN